MLEPPGLFSASTLRTLLAEPSPPQATHAAPARTAPAMRGGPLRSRCPRRRGHQAWLGRRQLARSGDVHVALGRVPSVTWSASPSEATPARMPLHAAAPRTKELSVRSLGPQREVVGPKRSRALGPDRGDCATCVGEREQSDIFQVTGPRAASGLANLRRSSSDALPVAAASQTAEVARGASAINKQRLDK